MKVEGYVFGFIAVFFLPATLVYWFLSKDPTGTTALALCCGLGVLIGYYLLQTSRRMEPRPEDRGDGDISDGAGPVGFFSPYSYWPIAIAASVTVASLGPFLGWWLTILGAIGVLGTVAGLVLEYYVGQEAREAQREQPASR